MNRWMVHKAAWYTVHLIGSRRLDSFCRDVIAGMLPLPGDQKDMSIPQTTEISNSVVNVRFHSIQKWSLNLNLTLFYTQLNLV